MMGKAYLFYNPLAGGGKILEDLDALQFVLDEETVLCDMTKPETYEQALFAMEREDYFVVCGGDGTLNRFVNLTGQLHRPNEVYYYPAGENNDFARDFGRCYGDNPFRVTKHLQTLPQARIGNKTNPFLTGLIFHSSDRIRRTSRKKLGYTEKNTPRQVFVTIDGVQYPYEKVCFAAVVAGKYCGGGLLPDASRSRGDDDLSCVLIHSCGKLRGRHLLDRLRKGRPVASRHLSIQRGSQIRMSFDAPVRLCADGEVHHEVSEFTACIAP